jgi:hypothetical protein
MARLLASVYGRGGFKPSIKTGGLGICLSENRGGGLRALGICCVETIASRGSKGRCEIGGRTMFRISQPAPQSGFILDIQEEDGRKDGAA